MNEVRKEGETKQITTDTSDYASLSLSVETNSIVTTRVDVISSLWSFALASGDAKQINTESRTLFGKTGISHTSSGRLLYSKKTGEEINIFSSKDDGSDERQLTSGAKFNFEPRPTADGKFVVFSSNRSGYHNLWRIDADGKNPLQLTNFQNGLDNHLEISPDGKTVIFARQGTDGGKSVLMRVSIDGGEAAAVFPESQSSNLFPRLSADGKSLAYQTFHYDD